jgi:predicted acylesterase/phospholipase RssA
MPSSSHTNQDNQQVSKENEQEKRYLGLSFSGGGYRATAFSLGTMTFLQDLDLMEKVKVLSGVSGGSVAVGFYICSKASIDNLDQFNFQNNFYTPLFEILQDEGMANSFVQLKHLLNGTKLIKEAANHLDTKLNLLFESNSQCSDATFNSSAIANLLHKNTSPDYVFFNTTNITTLGLFRFGLQRNKEDKDKKPVFLLNKYYLAHEANLDHDPTNNLYEKAQGLRLADGIAASFAFPGGFEPLIFPDDFLDADGCNCFRKTLICDGRDSLAFLDGGLYDNLGLASIEDIRCFTLKQIEEGKQATPISYVIATDADNIQPGIGFYSEPELSSSDRSLVFYKICKKVLSNVFSAFKKKPGYVLIFCFLTVLLIITGIPITIILLPLMIILLLLIFLGKQIPREVLNLVIKTPGDLGWMQKLGMSDQTEDNNLPSFAFDAMLALLNKRRQTLLTALSTRRLGQLLPAFNGYLKRTRSLTYGYLHQAFKLEKDQQNTCYLIRNLIFELNLGPDPDPDSALDLITLPVSDYRKTSKKEPIAIASKILIADYIADHISRLSGDLPEDLKKCYDDLEVEKAAKIWMILRKKFLSVEEGGEIDEMPIAEPIFHDCDSLRRFLKCCKPAQDQRKQLRKDLFDEEVQKDHKPTWIPLLCEMATNLSTTLWLKGYYYYLPKDIKDNSGKKIKAGWYSYMPVNKLEEQLIINFKESKIASPAAKVAIVVGYINTCFNIIEFFYSRWAASPDGTYR